MKAYTHKAANSRLPILCTDIPKEKRRRGHCCPICVFYGKNEAEFKAHWKEKHAPDPHSTFRCRFAMRAVHRFGCRKTSAGRVGMA